MHVHQVVAADRQRVAVARDDPHQQIGPADLEAGGHRRGAAVNRVDAVGVHVIGKPARAADARDEHHLFSGGTPSVGSTFFICARIE